MRKLSILVFCLLFANSQSSSHGGLVTFEDVPRLTNSSSITSDGFDFSSTVYPFFMSSQTSWAYNGTTVAGVNNVPNSNNLITMSHVSGWAFSIQGIDLGEFIGTEVRTVNVSGNFVGGGTISTSFVLDGVNDGENGQVDFQTFNFDAAWTNLENVSLQSPGKEFSFDNIQFEITAIPEPTSIALVGMGIIGMGFAARRKKLHATKSL